MKRAMEEEEKDWLDFMTAAAYLNVSRSTLSVWVQKKKLTPRFKGASRNKYFTKEDLDAYIEAFQKEQLREEK